MKKILLSFVLALNLFGDDIVVYNNEYNVLTLDKKVKKLIVGNKEMINVSLLNKSSTSGTLLKIFGKKSGNTSMLLMYRDGSIQNYHIYVNENLGFIQKMINIIEPNLALSKVGDGSTVISGTFNDPHDKKRIYALLENGGVDLKRLMDLTETTKVNKMVRTKLYLVEINNNKAKDMGGVTGLGFFSEYLGATINPLAANGATFSGWLLDNAASFTTTTGNSVTGTLNFLAESGLGKILDDTVLMTTEDENASFRVGGDVYIPTSMTQNSNSSPTIQVEKREYGLELSLTSAFMEKEGFIHINVEIEDSEFDTNAEHDVQLGDGVVIPSFISKNITTNVVVKSGQVLVLGGRLHTEDTESEEKVPFFSDIPIIGELFKHTVSGVKNNDLLFFLVPEIIDANEEIDDTEFYKEFKQNAAKFHKEMLDTNTTEKKNSLVVLNESNAAQDSFSIVTPMEDETVIIELEEETPVQEELVQKEVIQEEKIQQERVEEDLPQVQEISKPLYFSVIAENLLLRNAPLNGNVIDTWRRGHLFSIAEEKILNGEVWVRIKEDCMDRCIPVEQNLWVAKRYVKSDTITPSQEIVEPLYYRIATESLLLREAPLDGKVVDTWERGHLFSIAEEKSFNSEVWVRIKEDCIDGCKASQRRLWVAKRYITAESSLVTPLQKSSEPLYRVTANNLLLRNAPIDGESINVWEKGHLFSIAEEKTVNGEVWVRIKEDCIDGCKALEGGLWVAKRYTKLQ